MRRSSSRYDSHTAWEDASAAFNELRGDLGPHVSYGPFAPAEDELALLGPLSDLAVLDLGCGGGYNTVQFARRGAQVIALDFSARQIAAAQNAARAHGVQASFVLDRAETLSHILDASVDLVFSAGVLPYVAEIEACLAACQRVLRGPGRLVFSIDHPVRSCFYDCETQELTGYPERSYYESRPRSWLFANTHVLMRTFDRPLSLWVDLLIGAGFHVRRLVEPPVPPHWLDELFPADSALAALRNIPHTLIIVADASD